MDNISKNILITVFAGAVMDQMNLRGLGSGSYMSEIIRWQLRRVSYSSRAHEADGKEVQVG